MCLIHISNVSIIAETANSQIQLKENVKCALKDALSVTPLLHAHNALKDLSILTGYASPVI